MEPNTTSSLPETLPACVPAAPRLPLYCGPLSLFFPPPIIGAPPREAARTIESNEIPLSRVINIDYNRLYLLGRVEPPSRAAPLGPPCAMVRTPVDLVPPARLITLLPTRFASSSATSGATVYLDAHIRCVSAACNIRISSGGSDRNYRHPTERPASSSSFSSLDIPTAKAPVDRRNGGRGDLRFYRRASGHP